MASDAENIEELRRELADQRVLIENLYRHLRLGQLDLARGSGDTPPGVEDAIRAGNLIQAIKLWREATGDGLVESKTAVEAIRDRLV